ncbi:MAG: antibiotic biosynthesis monooxygenase [Rhodobacterales bacterium]|nr:MAG: antibiotic biosynthesis monooxygenase [Rhodobacterales bacterium]
MYLAMNRFKVKKDRAEEFEAMWKGRDSELPTLEGFVEFRLLVGPEAEDHILYSSHTFWETEENFIAWTQSEAFKKSHAKSRGGKSEPMTLGHPTFEGFTTIQKIDKDGNKS